MFLTNKRKINVLNILKVPSFALFVGGDVIQFCGFLGVLFMTLSIYVIQYKKLIAFSIP